MSSKIYPIGIQNFEKIRKDGYFYIDKTALIYKLVKTGSYYFLSRPVVLEKVCCYLLLKLILKEEKNFSKDWRWRVWRRTGLNIRLFIWI